MGFHHGIFTDFPGRSVPSSRDPVRVPVVGVRVRPPGSLQHFSCLGDLRLRSWWWWGSMLSTWRCIQNIGMYYNMTMGYLYMWYYDIVTKNGIYPESIHRKVTIFDQLTITNPVPFYDSPPSWTLAAKPPATRNRNRSGQRRGSSDESQAGPRFSWVIPTINEP